MAAQRGEPAEGRFGRDDRVRPCPHGCPGGHAEDEYYGGDCPHRDSEPFEGYRDEDGAS